jgi:hypothetical protein
LDLALKINPQLAEIYLLAARAGWGLFFASTCAKMQLFDIVLGT